MTDIKNTIIKELSLESLDEESQDEILSKMTESVIKRILVETLEKLSEEDRVEFEKLQEKESSEEMDAFLNSKIDNYEEMVQKIVTDFKKEMKESISNLTDNI